MLVLTRQQVRKVDEQAIRQLGIPGIVLMENAARGAAEAILQYLKEQGAETGDSLRAAVVCGGGNNGGDGYAIARHLHNAGCRVHVEAVVDPAQLRGDAAINARIVQNMGLHIYPLTDTSMLAEACRRWAEANLIVDALLGTGFQGPLRPPLMDVIMAINQTRREGKYVVAVDIPSGLDCDSGQPSPVAVEADLTVTFVAQKTGFRQAEAARYVGRVVVVDIGIPPELVRKVLQE